MDSKDYTLNEKLEQNFIKRLIELRLSKNISARELSLSLGQNVNYINLIENGKRLPSLEGFFNICVFFNIDPSDFFIKQIKVEKSKKEQLITLVDNMSASQIEAILNLITLFSK